MVSIKRLLIAGNIVIVAATLLVYLTSYFPPEKLWIFTTLGLVYPLLFFANCIYIILWLFQDVKWMLPSVLCVLLGWNYTTGFIGVHNNEGGAGKEDITILTYNTHFFSGVSVDNTKTSIFEVADFMKAADEPDIICLQELNMRFKDPLMQKFEGYKFIGMEGKRTAILTRFPVLASGEIDFGTRTNSCVWSDILINQDTFRIYSIHLQSNNITKATDQMLDNIDLQEKSTWKDAGSILSRYRSTAIKRAEQAELIREHAEKCNYNIIICGDMNEPPSSYTYNRLSEGMKDSFREKGAGIESTYAGRLPFLRIDYILIDESLEVTSYNTHKVDYSDHYPVTASFRSE